jgi:hypothetical protein
MENLTLPLIFEKITRITDEKIDKTFYDVNKIKSNPNIPKIPGMDLTANGSILTYEQFHELERTYPTFISEKEALKVAFSGTNAFVMNKNIFHDLCTSLGLVRIYSSSQNNDIYKTRLYSEAINEHKRDFENHMKLNKLRISIGLNAVSFLIPFCISMVMLFLVIGVWFGLIKRLDSIFGNITLTISGYSLVCLISSFFISKVHSLNTLKVRIEEEIEKRKEPLKHFLFYLFKGGVVEDNHTISSVTHSAVRITVPNPPESTREKIISIISNLPKLNNKEKICTIADPATVTVKHEADIIPPRPADPGIVIEYGHFAVILPDTFYNVSELESSFLEKCLRIAEQWDVKKYLLN